MKKKAARGSVDVWPLENEAPKLTHVNEVGDAHMVDVSAKPETAREAIASGVVTMDIETAKLIDTATIAKGDVLAVARIAGIQAAKRAAELIPLCHPLRLTGVDVDLRVDGPAVFIRARVRAFDRSGVEMEALAAVSAAALTVYDMCKAVDRGMVISEIQLEEKRGGKSGTWTRDSLRQQVRNKPRKSAKTR
ncbi:MAG TPA: cyclic pyranopterin monophosphate synthase MoaC [Kofleriaceae bacterium]